MLSMTTIRKRVKELAKLVNAPQHLITLSDSPSWMGGKYVEIDDQKYYYIGSERGEIYEKNSTNNIRELLYWILKDITSEIASDYELSNRIQYVDSRRLWFKKWIELIGMIDPEFSQRLCLEIEQILKEHPYKDGKELKHKPKLK